MERKTDPQQKDRAKPLAFRAILNHKHYSNSHFWKELTSFENGRLMQPVLATLEKLIFFHKSPVPRELYSTLGVSTYVYSPALPDLAYALRSVLGADDCDALERIMNNSLISGMGRYQNALQLDAAFKWKPTPTVPSYSHQISVKNPDNFHPGFLGHPDFVMPSFAYKSQITSNFWLSALMVAAGVAALVVAFAYLQAAAMVLSGVATATIGTAAILGGLVLFRSNRNKIAAENEQIDLVLSSWRPVLGN